MRIEKERYLRVQPVEEVKPARPVYNERKQEEKRKPEITTGESIDCLV